MSFLLGSLINVLLNAASLYLLTNLIDEIVYTGGIKFFVIGGVLLGLVNFIVKPLMKLLALPFMFLSGGLFLIVINMSILWGLSYFLKVAQFQDVTLVFPNFSSYVIGAIVFGVINWTSHLLIK